MDRIQELLQEVARQHRHGARRRDIQRTIAIDLTEDGVMITFVNGRQQRVHVIQREGYYRLTSVILKRRLVEKIGHVQLLPLIWQRNRETNLVAFDLDIRDRLIGCIEQPVDTADVSEMFLYLEHLAWECDQLEYLLSGLEVS